MGNKYILCSVAVFAAAWLGPKKGGLVYNWAMGVFAAAWLGPWEGGLVYNLVRNIFAAAWLWPWEGKLVEKWGAPRCRRSLLGEFSGLGC